MVGSCRHGVAGYAVRPGYLGFRNGLRNGEKGDWVVYRKDWEMAVGVSCFFSCWPVLSRFWVCEPCLRSVYTGWFAGFL